MTDMNELAVVDYAEQVLKVYSPTEEALKDLEQRYGGQIYEVTTTAGMKLAREARAEVRGYRVDLEKKRKEIKGPVLELTRKIDSEAKRITASLLELEEPIDEQIKAEENRKEQEKAAAEEAERQRKQAILDSIDAIRARPLDYIGSSPDEISAVIEKAEAKARTITEDFDTEFLPMAQLAMQDALAKLRQMLESAKANEAEKKRLAEEAARMEEQRKADEAARKQREEAERVERQERERKEAAEREARLEQERKEREARAAEDEERRNAIAVEERRLKEQQERAAKEEAERREQERQRQEKEAAARLQREINTISLIDAAKEARKFIVEQCGPTDPLAMKLAAAIKRAESDAE